MNSTLKKGVGSISPILNEYTTVEKAKHLYLSKETIRTHRKRLLNKFSAK